MCIFKIFLFLVYSIEDVLGFSGVSKFFHVAHTTYNTQHTFIYTLLCILLPPLSCTLSLPLSYGVEWSRVSGSRINLCASMTLSVRLCIFCIDLSPAPTQTLTLTLSISPSLSILLCFCLSVFILPLHHLVPVSISRSCVSMYVVCCMC